MSRWMLREMSLYCLKTCDMYRILLTVPNYLKWALLELEAKIISLPLTFKFVSNCQLYRRRPCAISRTCLAWDAVFKSYRGRVCSPTLTAGKTADDSQRGAPPCEKKKNLLYPQKTSSLPLSSRQILVTIMHFSHGGAKSGSDLQKDGRRECRPGWKVKGFILVWPLSYCHGWVYEEGSAWYIELH